MQKSISVNTRNTRQTGWKQLINKDLNKKQGGFMRGNQALIVKQGREI